MSTLNVLGVDPGGTTGLAVLEFTEPDTVRLITADELDLESILRFLYDPTNLGDIDHIAVERYVIGSSASKLTRQYEALYVIGAVLSAGIGTNTEVRLQTPGDAKAIAPNDRLKDMGLWPKGPHAKDAIRHGLLCLRSLTRAV